MMTANAVEIEARTSHRSSGLARYHAPPQTPAYIKAMIAMRTAGGPTSYSIMASIMAINNNGNIRVSRSISISPLFEIASVLVRLDHVARCIVNANHGLMCSTAKLSVADSLRLV